MPPQFAPFERPGLIVCEGPDDARLLVALLNHDRLDTVWVEYVEGESQFRRHIRQLRTRPGFDVLRALAVVRDADRDATAKFAQACAVLQEAQYPVPDGPG